jgi:molecular chaperone DnaK (HSP70)
LKKHGSDPREVPRARLRMLDAIEKVRKLLSGNKESDLNCESLLDDIDFSKTITRDEFEKLISSFT